MIIGSAVNAVNVAVNTGGAWGGAPLERLSVLSLCCSGPCLGRPSGPDSGPRAGHSGGVQPRRTVTNRTRQKRRHTSELADPRALESIKATSTILIMESQIPGCT